VNNLKVRRIPLAGEEDKRPIKGYELCCHLYANIYLCAKKNSGKTTVIYNIINRCAGRDTIVIAFVSTLHNDANWGAIKNLCDDKGIPFVGYTSLVDEEGVDQLQALVKSLQDKAGEEKKEDAPDAPTTDAKRAPFPCMGLTSEPEPEADKKKPRKTPYRAPEYIIVLDDLSDELKKKSVATLLKKNRHFKCKVIISSQWLNDLPPSGLGQMNLVCLFRGFSIEKLGEFHSKARLAIPLQEFIDLYKDATAEEYGFLYIDMDNNVYRKKFDRCYE
jgi:hypothetical protein